MRLNGKSVALVGFGKSNRAMYEHLSLLGLSPIIRNKEVTDVPSGARLITDNYLDTSEDVVFRSPVIRPDRISVKGTLTTESIYALELTRGVKIGVTGSDGKTTTSTLIHRILSAQGLDANLCGNIGSPIIGYAPYTTEKSYTVCELSSFQLTCAAPVLDVAVITNITENHLDWHTDMDEYIEAKRGILKHAKKRVLVYDDPVLRTLCRDCDGLVLISKERPRHAPSAAQLVYRENGAIYCDGERVLEISDIRLPGDFNITNVQCAIGAARGYASRDAIKQSVQGFFGVDSRLSLVDTVEGVSFIDSSIDSTPSRTAATLGALDITKCVVILGGYDKNLCYSPLRGALNGAKAAVLCGESSDKIFGEISGICKIYREQAFEDAVLRAYSLCSRGDSVVLSPACASFDMFDSYIQKSQKFKETVRGLK